MEARALVSQSGKCCGACGCQAACGVRPRMSQDIETLLRKPERLFELTAQKGSPLNIILPHTVLENRRQFRAELERRSIAGRVLLTTKPNKSRAVLTALAYERGTVDVSSAGALTAALSAGIPGDEIQASGPKSIEYLFLALTHGATVSVDSLHELSSIQEILRSNANLPRATILLRISGFRSDRVRFTPSDTPFGIRVDRVNAALDSLTNADRRMVFAGIHFHLLGGSKEERIIAFENALETTRDALARGLVPKLINIGGGFKIQYAHHREEWQRFQSYLKESLLGRAKPITWEGTGLGLRIEGGRISGMPAFIDHAPNESGAQEFASFLDHPSAAFDQATVGQLVRDLMLELHVEPGRALLDQAGVTIARINAVKESTSGEPLILLDMNHSHLLSREMKLLTQPVFLPLGAREPCDEGFYLFGNLCIATDLIQYQKVYPGFSPHAGDLVVFVNTAAYQMDFSESSILHQKLPHKVALLSGSDGMRVIDDSEVSAAHFLHGEFAL